jgi:ABC-type uncharacterized transport system ATPase subunit
MSDVMDGQPGDMVLRLAGISKSFGPLKANDGISFALKRGEVLALLGENGAGKTTLMNILFGHYVADAGEITAFGRTLPPGKPSAALDAGIGMVHQHFTLADNLTVLDNIVLGTQSLWSWRQQGAAARQRVAQLAADFGLAINPDARVSDLSVGERQRVEILKALYRNARILILDEPTAVLTPQESEGLFATLEKLVARGLAIIFISHKLHEVLAVSDRVLVLRQGRLVAERMTEGATRQELAELMVGRPIPIPKVEPQAVGPELVKLAAITVAGSHGRNELEAVDLTLHEGEIFGIAGVSGNGQAALAELLSGLVPASAGTFMLFGERLGEADAAAMVGRGVGRIPEDRHAVGLIGDMSITENMISERYRERPFSNITSSIGRRRAASRKASSPASTCAARDRRRRPGSCPAATCRNSFWGARWRAIRSSSWRHSRRAASISARSAMCMNNCSAPASAAPASCSSRKISTSC